jgi:hypothetical protein
MRRTVLAGAAAVLGALPLVAGLAMGSSLPISQASPTGDKWDFMFQVDGYQTANQGGHTLNLYFSYRYNQGIANSALPDYRALRGVALAYLDRVGPSQDLFWEILDREICTQLAAGFPVEAISCQMQVFPRAGDGIPDIRSTTYTIGDIAPLAIPGPVAIP